MNYNDHKRADFHQPTFVGNTSVSGSYGRITSGKSNLGFRDRNFISIDITDGEYLLFVESFKEGVSTGYSHFQNSEEIIHAMSKAKPGSLTGYSISHDCMPEMSKINNLIARMGDNSSNDLSVILENLLQKAKRENASS